MRRRPILVAVAIATGVVVAGALIASRLAGNDDAPVDRAVALLGNEREFDSSREAVTSFAAVYQHLVDATREFPKDCDVDAGKGRCLALNEAASWALNFSPATGHCTQPAIQQGRVAILEFVKASGALRDNVTAPPALPPIPSC